MREEYVEMYELAAATALDETTAQVAQVRRDLRRKLDTGTAGSSGSRSSSRRAEFGSTSGRSDGTMVRVTAAGGPATQGDPARGRLDRPILVSNLVSGALCLSPLAIVGWPLLVIGSVYVVAGSLFLAAVYVHEVRTTRQEVVAWVAPWLVAVALWTTIVIGIDFANAVSHYLLGLFVGLLIATPCYLAWQIVALAVRQLLAWRSGRPSLQT